MSKKEIPMRTKFGPVEGDLRNCAEAELHHLKNGHDQRLPLLFVDGSSVIETTNEYTSNWMRFVRLAHTFTEQNLLLCETDKKLFFQSCQIITPKHELKVGYSEAYAKQYGLNYLQPDEAEKIAMFERWPCFECDEKFENFDLLQAHLNNHEDYKKQSNGKVAARTRKRRMVRSRLTTRKVSGPTVRYACCYCSKVFSKFTSFKRHTEFAHSFVDAELGNNSVLTNSNKENTKKSNKCDICRRYFSSIERLEKHRLMHCTSSGSKAVQCMYCPKKVLTQSALAMHVKSHIFKSCLFNCLYCSERYQHAAEFMNHVTIHAENGLYNCERCGKKFKEYTAVRKHFRAIHSTVLHFCPECGRGFKGRNKLKQHRLSHSDVREFLCSDCGRQFKRKDKLRGHILTVHSKLNNKKSKDKDPVLPPTKVVNEITIIAAQTSAAPVVVRKKKPAPKKSNNNEITPKAPAFVAKVAPTDYQRFIYKCHDCLLGFKRRGMLVNHLAKRHQDVSIDSVPELNLPILKAQRYYYCQYCDKVYKSSSKRKAHILKYHPGLDLPMSSRQKAGESDMPTGLPNPSFSETVGNFTTHAQRCPWCHKQYASKARLLQHQRKLHMKEIEMCGNGGIAIDGGNQQMIGDDVEYIIPTYENISGDFTEQQHHQHNVQQPYMAYEPENKLLKLSSAALEASLNDDFPFFEDKTVMHNGVERLDSGLSKVDVNFKVVGSEYVVDSMGNGGGGSGVGVGTAVELNRLPRLFEDIDYMSVKSVTDAHSLNQQQHDHHQQLNQLPLQQDHSHHQHQLHRRELGIAQKQQNYVPYPHNGS